MSRSSSLPVLSRLVLVVVLLAGLVPALILAPAAPWMASAGAPPSGGTCVAPAGDLLTNGGFELPDISPDTARGATPDGWSLVGQDATIRRGDDAFAGMQFVTIRSANGTDITQLTQSIDVSDLAGATLTLTVQARDGNGSIAIGTSQTDVGRFDQGWGPFTATYQVPASGSTTGVDVTFSTFGDGLDFDAADVTATCPNSPPVFATTTANQTLEATSSDGATLPTTVALPTATDDDSDAAGNATDVTCTATIGGNATTVTPGQTRFPIGSTTVTCEATDVQPNGTTNPDSGVTTTFTVTVRDTRGPVITWQGGPQRNATYRVGAVPAAPTCTATDRDNVSNPSTCTVSGYSDQPGRHILTARATDARGNVTVETRTYTVTGAPTATTRPTTPTATPVTPVPTATPTRAPGFGPGNTVQPPPTRPGRATTATATPAPTQPPAGPTRPPRR